MHNRFDEIAKGVREMSREQAEGRFAEVSQVEVLTYFERGAILDHGRSVWFRESKTAYQDWVLNVLRIPLDLAGRLERVYKGITVAGLTEEDLRGIPMSSVLVMLPMMTNADHRKRLPEVLAFARQNGVAAVREFTYQLRGIERKPKERPRNLNEALEADDWGRVTEILGEVQQALAQKEHALFVFAVHRKNPEGDYCVRSLHFSEVAEEAKEVLRGGLRRVGEAREPEPAPEAPDAPMKGYSRDLGAQIHVLEEDDAA